MEGGTGGYRQKCYVPRHTCSLRIFTKRKVKNEKRILKNERVDIVFVLLFDPGCCDNSPKLTSYEIQKGSPMKYVSINSHTIRQRGDRPIRIARSPGDTKPVYANEIDITGPARLVDDKDHAVRLVPTRLATSGQCSGPLAEQHVGNRGGRRRIVHGHPPSCLRFLSIERLTCRTPL